MKRTIAISIFLLSFLFFFTGSGCENSAAKNDLFVRDSNDIDLLSVYARYLPEKIDILPLTEFQNTKDPERAELNLYVSLLDAFGSQIKTPCKIRFELYQRIQRSAEPKGRRLMVWPDADLTEPEINNRYWRNFLRAYEFNLPYQPESSQSYILEVTCFCPNGRRPSAEFILKNTE